QFSWVVKEVLFVFAVLLGGTFAVLQRYSRNLRLMFDLQLGALRQVESGHYDVAVPVVTHDEFSTIAEQANRMIAGLRERERIRRILGKFIGDAAMAVFGLGGGGSCRDALAAARRSRQLKGKAEPMAVYGLRV
ncbi:MAG: hypothetical protein ABIL09_19105, partial [Gemmatimonadota bacterium]